MPRTPPPDSGPASCRALALAVLGLTTGCVLGGRVGAPPEKDGRAVYLESCASCHGAAGRGDGPAARALRRPPSDLTRLAETHGGTFPSEEVRRIITGERAIDAHGDREMPVWSDRFLPTGDGATVGATIYAQRRLDRILHYLESIQPPARR